MADTPTPDVVVGGAERPTDCRCGRPMRLLNVGSDTVKCIGCGWAEELCRCPGPSTEEQAMQGPYDG